MKNILFIAPPAGGKGTLSDLLIKNHNYKHISSGDLLRNVDPNTELGKKVNSFMSSGKLVSDNIIIELIKEKLNTFSKDDHFILDGFPRNLEQAKSLDEVLKNIGVSLDKVILIDVPYEICLKRVLGRQSCPSCKRTYNKFFIKPVVENVCDDCKAQLISRVDDNEETFSNRFKIYEELTKPLVDYYKTNDKLVIVEDFDNPYDQVVSEINND